MIKNGNKQFFLNRKSLIIVGYIVASIWFAATAAFAFYSLTVPVPQPQVLVAPVSVGPVDQQAPAVDSVMSDEAGSLRDPFVKGVGQGVSVQKPVGPSGIMVKAIILSVKNGVVLEDSGGGVYFLSEGESANGIRVNGITKTTVTVEVRGNVFDLSI